MAALRLFGVTFPIDAASGILKKPNVAGLNVVTSDCGSVDATHARLSAQFEINGVHTLQVKLVVRVRSMGGDLVPVEGFHDQTGESSRFRLVRQINLRPDALSTYSPVHLDTGPLVLKERALEAQEISVDQSGRLIVSCRLFSSLISPQVKRLPFELGYGGPGRGITVDLSAGTLGFTSHAFTLTSAVKLRHSTSAELHSFFKQEHESVEIFSSRPGELQTQPPSLRAAIGPITLRFRLGKLSASAGATVLPLHAELLNRTQDFTRANPIAIPLGVSDYELGVVLSPSDSGPKVTHVFVAPGRVVDGKARLLLHTYNFSDTKNLEARWAIEQTLTLGIRPELPQRPATFLIPKTGAAGVPVRRHSQGMLHGYLPESRIDPAPKGLLRCDRDALHAPDPELLKVIERDDLIDLSIPWLESVGTATSNRLLSAKPGETWVRTPAAGSTANTEVETFQFVGQRMVLPLLGEELRVMGESFRKHLDTVTNESFRKLTATIVPTRHHTYVTERPGTEDAKVRPHLPFSFAAKRKALPPDIPNLPEQVLAAQSLPRLKVDEHTVIRDYGPVRVKLTLPRGVELDYVVLYATGASPDKSAVHVLEKLERIDLVPGSKLFSVQGDPVPVTGWPLGVIKLRAGKTLRSILEPIFTEAQLGTDPVLPSETSPSFDNPRRLFRDVLDSALQSEAWTGLVLFNVPVGNTVAASELAEVLPKILTLSYLAFSPEKPAAAGAVAARRFSVSGRVLWRNTPDKGSTPRRGLPDTHEARFRMMQVDAAWHDNALVFFHALAHARFASFLGLDFQKHDRELGQDLKIIGSYEKSGDEERIRFVGQLNDPLPLLPEDVSGPGGFGPIRQVFIKSAEITKVEDRVTLLMNGALDVRAFPQVASFDVNGDPRIDFSGLGIQLSRGAEDLGEISDVGGAWRRIQYPRLSLRNLRPSFRIGFLELKLESLGINFGTVAPVLPGVPLDGFEAPTGGRGLRLGLKLELMKLPELALNAFDRLSFGIHVFLGVSNKRWDPQKLRIQFDSLSGRGLKLSLLRFLEFEAESIRLDKDPQGLTWLRMTRVAARILGKEVVKELSIALFSSPQRQGFIAYLDGAAPGASTGALQVHWVLAGHNVGIPDNLAPQLVSLEPDEKARAQIRQQIAATVSADHGSSAVVTVAPAHQGRWLFAAGFDFFSIIEGKFLFQDRAYYGIALRGKIFEEWFGYKFAISVLYRKQERPEEDSFIVAVTVPEVTVGAFSFMGGVLSLEVVMNGGFALDIGFPWLQGGTRAWNRALSCIVGIFQGSGGFYLRKYQTQSPVGDDLTLGGGYAVQFGLGVAAGGGVFKVWATIGIYAVFEGEVTLRRLGSGDARETRLQRLHLSGAVGLLGRAAGELNFWIISARVEVLLSAEARTTLDWEHGGGGAKLRVDFEVYAGANAKACIGKGWFKLCASISVQVSIPVSYTLEL